MKNLSCPGEVVEVDMALSSEAGVCLGHGQSYAVFAVCQSLRGLQNPEIKSKCPVNDR